MTAAQPLQRITVASLPPLPERVRCYPMHRPFAGMLLDGPKDIETRGRPWRWPPAWIAIYAAQRVVNLQADAMAELRRVAVPEKFDRWQNDQPSRVHGLVYIDRSRPLRAKDLPRSFIVYRAPEPGGKERHAWLVRHRVRFVEPLTLASLGIYAAPQDFAYAHGGPLLTALAAAVDAGRAETVHQEETSA